MKKRIIFLLHIPPPVHGSSMVGKWIKESSLINDTFDCSYINLLASKKVSESGKVTIGKLLGMFVICFKLLVTLTRQQPNLCYLALTTTGAAFYRDALLVGIMKVFRVKRIYHLHNKGVAKASKNKINNFLYHFVFKNATIILLSEYLYTDVKNFVSKEKIVVCPNGIPPKITTQLLDLNTINDKVPVILFLSNLITSKGVYILLEALAIIKKKEKNFRGIFVGGEGDINALQFHEKCKIFGLSDEIVYLGKKYDLEKETIFRQADLFVFPTYYHNECFPLVLLEAMQYSLPIISTYEGGIQDIVSNGVTGFLVKQQQIEELVEKIETLLDNSELRIAMGKRGRDRFEKHFTLFNFEKKLYNIFIKIIK